MTPRSSAIRLAAFYGAVFAAVGIHIPFWPLWLASRGLSPAEIGWLMAAGYLTRLVANPTVGHFADHRGDRKRPLLVLSLAAGALWLLFVPFSSFWPLMIITVVAVFPFTSLMPVGDSLAMMEVVRHRLDYGRIRLWGSLAFIALAALTGRLLAIWPVDILPFAVSAALFATALAAHCLPDARVPAREAPPPPVGPLLKSGLFLIFIATAAFNNAAHTVYYAFATIHWKASGLSDTAIGLLWSEGVVAEVVLFALSGKVVARLGPAGLLLAAGLAGALRWAILGTTAGIGWVMAAQLLHAATFGCAHLGAMHFILRAVPPSLSVRAQGLYAAIAVGLAPGLMTPLSGALYDRLAGGAFWVMALLSALSAAAAWQLFRRWRGEGLIDP
jgi:PPP family 3-phenylpropionic acid transporter